MKKFVCMNIKLAGLFLLVLFFNLSSVVAQGEGDDSAVLPPLDKDLKVTSTNSWYLTDTECYFSVVLPEIVPSQVSLGNPVLPSGATLITASKNLWVEGRNSGTIIELIIIFSQSGTIELPPLEVLVEGQLHSIPFAPVDIFQNPKSLKPQVELVFQDELGNELAWQNQGSLQAVAGKPIFIGVQLRYVAALQSLTWDLTPQALFQQVENYEESFNLSVSELSHQFQPVARFSFVPLKTGIIQIPPITLEVRGYDENVHSLIVGNIPVIAQVAPEKDSSLPPEDAAVTAALAAAFSPPALEDEEPMLQVLPEVAQELAQLRWKERTSLPWLAATQHRQQFEQELGLTPGVKEPVLLLGWLGVGLALGALVITIVAICKKKLFLSVILGFLCILVLSVSLVYLKPSFQPTGILAASNLSRIPEPDATHLFPVDPYSVVQIHKEVLGWYYVEVAGLEGWIPKELVVPIQSKVQSSSEQE